MSSIGLAFDRERLTRVAAFAGLTAFAATRYVGTEARPPTLRVLALVAVAVAAAGGLSADGAAVRGARVAAAVRGAAMLLLLVIALLAAGVPAHLLLPFGWPTLVSRIGGGLQTVATALWPYAGHSVWAREDILLALAVVPLLAAVIGCWPARDGSPAAAERLRVRRFGALALLTALYVIGVVDSNGGSAILEGLVLLALVVAWLWLPGAGARRTLGALGWLAVAGTVAAGISLEVASSQAWFNYRAWDLLGARQPGISFTWDQTYGPIPWSRSQRTMFTVRGPSPGLWKVTTLDRFDGLRFVRSGTDPVTDEDLPLPVNDRWYEFARFTMAGLSSRLLPTEPGTTAGVNFSGQLRYQPDGTVEAVGHPLPSGATYTVMSYVPQPSPAELRAAPSTFPPAYLRYTAFDLPAPRQTGLHLAATDPSHPHQFFTDRTVYGPGLALAPGARSRVARRILASPYAATFRLARRLAARSDSAYDVALAVENYLKTNYAYSEQSPARRYPLEAFLFTDRIGYCQQFSGAMALMLRMDGIPARVAVGFRTGASGSAGLTRVRALDAHSWVEVYFTGIGWVPFDPTPPRTTLHPAQAPVFTQNLSQFDALAATVAAPPNATSLGLAATGRRRPVRAGSNGGAVVIGLASVVVLLALGLTARWLVGHGRLRRSLTGDGELAAIELVRALRALGYALPASPTLAQIERLVNVHGGREAARYVRLLRDRRYAPANGAVPTLRDRRRLRRALTARFGLDSRLRGQWALPPSATRVARRPAPTP